MRCLKRNKTPFWYALYLGKEMIEDEYGNVTGEYEVEHGKPVRTAGNISLAVGESATRQFGDGLEYDKVIVTEDAQFDEFSILWVDSSPVIEEDGSTKTPHDYIVTKVARSLNGVSIAVRKVKVQ